MHDKPTNEPLQRVGFLAMLPKILAGFSVSPDEVLTAAGLKPDALANPEGTIPYRAMGLLVQIAAERASCPHFGLLIGRQITTSTLGLVGELMRHSPNLRTALRNFAAHQHRNAHGGVAYLLESAQEATFGYAVYQLGVPGYDVICDAASMAAYTLVCELVKPEPPEIKRVLFARSEPENLKPYKDAFGERELRFDGGQNALLFPRYLLDRPLPGADRERRAELAEKVRSLLHAGEYDIETSVRRELRVAFIAGPVSLSDIASKLGMNGWNLSRSLAAAGTTFQKLLNESRCEFTKQLLRNTSLDVARISKIVGYNDPSVLTRAFTRWVGMTPTAWRLQSGSVA